MKKQEEIKEDLDEEDEEEIKEELEEESEEKSDEEDEEEIGLEEYLFEEEKLNVTSSKLHQFLMSQNNRSSLNQIVSNQIINLEKDLPPVQKNNFPENEEQINIDYMSSKIEDKKNYSTSSVEASYLEKKDFNTIQSKEDLTNHNQKELYSSISSISSEMSFVQKQMKQDYFVPEKLREDDFGKEHKKTVETVTNKMKENYKTY